MLCPPPPTLNPVTIFEAARLPHRANPSRAAGSFIGPSATCGDRLATGFLLGSGFVAPVEGLNLGTSTLLHGDFDRARALLIGMLFGPILVPPST
jgi:hypothetical protein